MIKKEFERINTKIKNATIKSCKVDGNGKITLGNLFDKNEVNLIGDYDNLIIEKVKKI